MATITTKGTLFNSELTNELFNKVKGHSALAKLCGQSPNAVRWDGYFHFCDGRRNCNCRGRRSEACR